MEAGKERLLTGKKQDTAKPKKSLMFVVSLMFGLCLLVFVLLTAGVYVVQRIEDALREPPFKDGKINLTISKETTYIDGPLNEDGTINYAAYFEKKYKKNIDFREFLIICSISDNCY